MYATKHFFLWSCWSFSAFARGCKSLPSCLTTAMGQSQENHHDVMFCWETPGPAFTWMLRLYLWPTTRPQTAEGDRERRFWPYFNISRSNHGIQWIPGSPQDPLPMSRSHRTPKVHVRTVWSGAVRLIDTEAYLCEFGRGINSEPAWSALVLMTHKQKRIPTFKQHISKIHKAKNKLICLIFQFCWNYWV